MSIEILFQNAGSEKKIENFQIKKGVQKNLEIQKVFFFKYLTLTRGFQTTLLPISTKITEILTVCFKMSISLEFQSDFCHAVTLIFTNRF